MTPARPFIEHPDAPAYFYCQDCDAAYDPQAGHQCDPLGAPRGILTALAICLVFWVLVAAGVIKLGWSPW